MMTMKIHNLAFLLLFQFPFVRDVALKISAPSPIMDNLQNPNRKASFLITDSIQLPIRKASATIADSQQVSTTNTSEVLNVVFKSTDGGQTWQDISEELPGNAQGEGFFANDKLPIYPSFPEKDVRTVLKTTRGTVFIGCDKGLFRSTNNGKTWKLVQTGGWAMKMVESDGVLLATSQVGIIRSSDGGENWDAVISEGGVGIAVENIKGGFAAITYNTTSETRRVRTSYDGGKTWQPIDAGLPASLSIASIVQVGDNFFCGHPSGIFRSSDKGKTWQLLLPSIEKKVFNLFVSGNVIYAIPRDGGC
jgi:photosystem II stability/assembly factor-like uncharacterized protein